MKQETFNVLFLCTGNSARSIMGEAILNFLGRPKFKAFSAGSHPVGNVNPLALEIIAKNRFPIARVTEQGLERVLPTGHAISTLCVYGVRPGGGGAFSIWPGQPMTAHWGVQDPAVVQGSDENKQRAFLKAYTELHRRISLFINLPFEKLSDLALQEKLDEIGRVK